LLSIFGYLFTFCYLDGANLIKTDLHIVKSRVLISVTKSKNQLFVRRSQYIKIKNTLHKQSEQVCMCFNTRRARTRDYTVFVTYGQASLCLYVTSLSFCFYLICPSRIAKRFECEMNKTLIQFCRVKKRPYNFRTNFRTPRRLIHI
jgi:hypothetical protein